MRIEIPPTESQLLAKFCEEHHVSPEEALRQAVSLLAEKNTKPVNDAAVDAFFGIWKDRADIGDSVQYQRALRSEWDKRDQSIDERLGLPPQDHA